MTYRTDEIFKTNFLITLYEVSEYRRKKVKSVTFEQKHPPMEEARAMLADYMDSHEVGAVMISGPGGARILFHEKGDDEPSEMAYDETIQTIEAW